MFPDDTTVLAEVLVHRIIAELEQRSSGTQHLSEAILTPTVSAALEYVWKFVVKAPWPPPNHSSPTCILANIFFKSLPDVWPMLSTWLSATMARIVVDPTSQEAITIAQRLDSVFLVLVKDDIFGTASTEMKEQILKPFTRLWMVDLERSVLSRVAVYLISKLDMHMTGAFIAYVGGSPSDLATMCIQRLEACKRIQWQTQYTGQPEPRAQDFASVFLEEARFVHSLMESSPDTRSLFLRAGIVKEIVALLLYCLDHFVLFLRRERRGTDHTHFLKVLVTFHHDLFFCMQRGPLFVTEALNAGLFEVYRKSIVLWIHPDTKQNASLDEGIASGICLQLELLLCLVYHKRVFPVLYRAYQDASKFTRVIPEDARWKKEWMLLGERLDWAKKTRDEAKNLKPIFTRLPCTNAKVQYILSRIVLYSWLSSVEIWE
jgi:hypothetical protein